MSPPAKSLPLPIHLPVEERVHWVLDFLVRNPQYHGAETELFRTINIVSVELSRTVFNFEVTEQHCNPTGNLHGGAATTILDWATATTLLTIAKPGFLDGGFVSRTITMTFLRSVPIGSTARIECATVAVGKQTAHVEGIIKVDEKPAIICRHDMVVFPSPKGKL
jgi:acyl-coenzyme A thioesterase 13